MIGFYTEEDGIGTTALGVANPINYLKLFFLGNGPLTDNGLGTNGMVRTKVCA